jgi:hypothetical protein
MGPTTSPKWGTQILRHWEDKPLLKLRLTGGSRRSQKTATGMVNVIPKAVIPKPA